MSRAGGMPLTNVQRVAPFRKSSFLMLQTLQRLTDEQTDRLQQQHCNDWRKVEHHRLR